MHDSFFCFCFKIFCSIKILFFCWFFFFKLLFWCRVLICKKTLVNVMLLFKFTRFRLSEILEKFYLIILNCVKWLYLFKLLAFFVFQVVVIFTFVYILLKVQRNFGNLEFFSLEYNKVFFLIFVLIFVYRFFWIRYFI